MQQYASLPPHAGHFPPLLPHIVQQFPGNSYQSEVPIISNGAIKKDLTIISRLDFSFKSFEKELIIIHVVTIVIFKIDEALCFWDKVIEAEIECIVSFNGVVNPTWFDQAIYGPWKMSP